MEKVLKYKQVITEDRREYYCPLDIAGTSDQITEYQLVECIEADVVGRYSGNLNVVQ